MRCFRWGILNILVLGLGLNLQAAAEGRLEGSSSVEVVFDPKEGRSFIKQITDFTIDEEYLFKTETKEQWWEGREGFDAQTKIEKRFVQSPQTVAWQRTFNGSRFRVFDWNFVSVTEFGCCGALDLKRLISKSTGKLVEAAYANVLQLWGYSEDRRLIGKRYVALARDSRAPVQLDRKSYIGTLSYFSETKIISRVRVYAQVAPGYGSDIHSLKALRSSNSDSLKHALEFGPEVSDPWNNLSIYLDPRGSAPAQVFNGIFIQGELFIGGPENSTASFQLAVSGDRLLTTGTHDLQVELVQVF